MSSDYGDIHKNFLRLMMSKSVLSEVEALRQLQICNVEESLGTFVEKINVKLGRYDQKLRIINNELTGNKEVVFLWISDASISQVQIVFTKADIQYLKLLLEEIICSDDQCLSEINSLNLAAKVIQKPFSLTQAKKLLDDWCSMHYFTKRQNNYFLGSRGIHEFQPFFKKHYPEVIKECVICNSLAFYYYPCLECPVVFHRYCLSDLRKTAKFCPNCKFDLSQSSDDTC